MDNDSQPTRRQFLGAAATFCLAPKFSTDHYGYIKPDRPNPSLRFYDASALDGFGKNKQAFLCNAYKKVTGHSWQTRKQFKGDCVGVGVTTAMDYLTVTQTLQKRSSWKGRHSIIGHYVGGKELAKQNPISSGARTVWLIDFLSQYGSLLAKKYGIDDLTDWDSETYQRFASGLTDNLKVTAKLHPLLHFNKIQSYSEARDAIASGHPVIIASTMGVARAKKDKNGFFYPKGYTPHCMCCIGVDDKTRPSILIQNSHGAEWAPGPKRYGFEPNGSAWVDAKTFDRYVGEYSDSWTVSLFRGYTVKRKYILW